MPPNSPIEEIYARLREIGFDPRFLRFNVLPEWWEDYMAEDPAKFATAENALSRYFGVTGRDLRDTRKKLALPDLGDVRLKRVRNEDADFSSASFVAVNAARLAAQHVQDAPDFSAGQTAAAVREAILQGSRSVSLKSLIEYCWSLGILCAHLSRVPKGAEEPDAFALLVSGRPAIILGSRKDSPAWLAIHTAHALGHLLLGHVNAMSPALLDAKIDAAQEEDPEEQAADEFARVLLTGGAEVEIPEPASASPEDLVATAKTFGKEHALSPAIAALLYARPRKQLPRAEIALKLLHEEQGGQQLIGAILRRHLAMDRLSPQNARLLSVLTGIAAESAAPRAKPGTSPRAPRRK